LLRAALASIRALEGADLAFEIIVGDNGSTDDTGTVAAEAGARLVYAPTPGAAAARNAAMRAATCDYIAFLDDDDAWTPEHIRPQLAFLRANPGYMGAAGQVVITDANLERRGSPWPLELPASGKVFTDFLAHYPQIGGIVVRAAARDTVGFFDERLLGDQDWDWQLRLASEHLIGFVPVPGVLFRQRSVTVDDDLRWKRLRYFWPAFAKNVMRAGAQRPSWPAIARIGLAHLGQYYWSFASSAETHAVAGEHRGTWRCLCRAFASSPLHAIAGAFRPGPFRRALVLEFRAALRRRL
jgi:glycosyltransferase involved in cell wall biosynthesis